MEKKFYLHFAAIIISLSMFNSFAFADNPNDIGYNTTGSSVLDMTRDYGSHSFYADNTALLYDNGPLINGLGTISGCNISILRSPLTTFGFGAQASVGNRMADDFTVPAGGWTIDSIHTFCYQTGSTTTSTITGIFVRIWSGLPGSGTVVFGDTSTNRMSGTSFSCIYRNSDSTSTNRPVMQNTATIGTTLPAGTYWLEVSYTGTLGSGPWQPPVSINGVLVTGNARQSLAFANVFNAALDGTNQQGMPFALFGGTSCPWPAIPSLSISNATYNGAPTSLSCGGAYTMPHHDDVIEFDLTGTDADLGSGDIITLSALDLPDPDCKLVEITPPLPIVSNAPITVHVKITRIGNPPPSCFGILSFKATDNCPATNEGICRLLYENPLPVEMSSFISTVNGNDVKLDWTTLSEINNSGFDIERSSSSDTWTKAGFVSGNGNSSNSNSYTFTDKALMSGTYNYRLKQIDFNGNFEYFNLGNEINIGTPETFSLSQNYPNPFNPTTKIGFTIPAEGFVNLVVFDNSGREVATLVNESKIAGYYTVNFNAAGISSGVYFYRLEMKGNENFAMVRKMVLVK